MGSQGGYKIGFFNEIFEGNEYGKVEVSSTIEFMWVKVGTEVGPCDGMEDQRDVGNMDGSGDRQVIEMGDMELY